MKLLNLRGMILTLALCIAVPQYVSAANAEPSKFQQVWNKYKIAIIAAGAGALALLGLGGGVAAYRSRSKELSQDELFAIQKQINEAGINAVYPSPIDQFIDIIHDGIDAQAPSTGDTALHRAVAKQNVNMVTFLLSKNANPLIKNNKSETAIAVAHDAWVKSNNQLYKQMEDEMTQTVYKQAKQASKQLKTSKEMVQAPEEQEVLETE